jgi:hypothetical protein
VNEIRTEVRRCYLCNELIRHIHAIICEKRSYWNRHVGAQIAAGERVERRKR